MRPSTPTDGSGATGDWLVCPQNRRTAEIAFVSAVTGARLDKSILDGHYCYANLRQSVLFEQAVRWSYEHGYRTFIEASSHPVLSVAIEESLKEYGAGHGVTRIRSSL